jgi:hypothetical protein
LTKLWLNLRYKEEEQTADIGWKNGGSVLRSDICGGVSFVVRIATFIKYKTDLMAWKNYTAFPHTALHGYYPGLGSFQCSETTK